MRHKLFRVITAACLAVISSSTVLLTPVFADTGTSGDAATESVQIKSIPGDTAFELTASQLKQSWPWYVTRASGLIAGVCLIIMMLSGVGLVTGHTFRFLEPLTAWATHRALGITFAIAVVVHVVMLLFDHFVPFSIPEIFVPWLSQYKPVTLFGVNVGSLWVALGVLALYLSILIVLTSLFWIDKKQKTWKVSHLLSYLVVVFVFFHALFLGTDTGSGWLRWVWIAAGVAILVAMIARLKRVGRL